jgi:hypothetical protein
VTLGVMGREGQFLLTMRGVRGVIAVEDHGRGGLGGARNKMIHERLCEALEVGAGHAVFAPRAGRGTRQVLRGIERYPLHAQLQQRIVPETIGIMAVGISRSALIAPLGEQIA